MRVGLITFHRALNYGAVLQTFALCKTINALDAECNVIDYRSIPLEETYYIFNFRREKNFLKCIAKGILKSYSILKKKKSFNQFVTENIPLSVNEYIHSNIADANNDYDFFITGSDQVWSPTCVGFDDAYFLSFADTNKKNSYAASIGCSIIPNDKREEYLRRLSGYVNISVREEHAVNLLNELGIDCKIEQNIDPTLLLTSNDYSAVSKLPVDEKYVLLFTVNMPLNLIEYAKKLGKEKNLKIIYINDKPICREKGIIYKSAVSPSEFVGYIKNAEYVVTNSFHGTVFSIIFRKRFFVEFNTKSGRNTRAEELLKRLGIDNKEITSSSLLKEYDVNWEAVEKVINEERKKSLEYLNKIIGDYCE